MERLDMTNSQEYVDSLEFMSEEELLTSLRIGAQIYKLRLKGKVKVKIESVQCPPRIRNDGGGDTSLSACVALDAENN